MSLSKLKLAISAVAIAVACGSIQQSSAQVLPFPTPAAAATVGVVAAAGAGAVIVGPWLGSAAAAAGTAAGLLTPIGWATIGVAALAVVLVSSDTSTSSPPRLIVSTRDTSQDPNADASIKPVDLGAGSPAGLYFANTSYQSSSEYFSLGFTTAEGMAAHLADINTCFAGGTFTGHCAGGNSTTWAALGPAGRLSAVKAWINAGRPLSSSQHKYGVSRVVQDGAFSNASRYAVYLIDYPSPTATTGTEYRAGGSTYFVFQQVSCPAGAQLDESSGVCYGVVSSLRDSQCNVSWDSVTGCPVVNMFDPDCSSFNLKATCGDVASPASITGTDSTGRALTVQHSTKQYTLPGGDAVAVIDSVPNPGSNTTTKTSTTLRPAVPGAVPVTTGTNAATLPGTGSSVGTNPVQQVTVTNWPTSLTNPQSGTGSTPAVTFPDSMKINPEGHSESEVPDASAESETVASDVKSMFDPLKQKLAPFSTLTIPSHASECPAVDIHWHAYTNLDIHSTAICDLLETPSTKKIIQGVLMLLITLGAIRILLGA